MNKKIIISLVSAIVLIAIFLAVWGSGIKKSTGGGKPDSSNSRDGSSVLSMLQFPQQDYESVLESPQLISYKEFMDGIKTGKRNFVWEIWALRKGCSDNYSLEQCNSHILEMIESNKNYSASEKERLRGIFTSYFSYESSIREIGLDRAKGKFDERYDELRKKRNELFSEEDRKLIFGMEESQVAFMDAAAGFSAENKNLSGKEKVKKYESLKREKLGPYYDALVKREDPYQNYQTELDFMQDDLAKYSEAESNRYVRSMLEKHFGAEEAERMLKEAKKEELLRLEREKKIKEYEAKEKKFISDNPQLSPDELKRRLAELRAGILGEESDVEFP